MNNDSGTTDKDQAKSTAKRKQKKATRKHTRPMKKNKIEKSPKEPLGVSQRALASRKNNVKTKVYRKYSNGDMNKYEWL